jgi:hypothetical protein
MSLVNSSCEIYLVDFRSLKNRELSMVCSTSPFRELINTATMCEKPRPRPHLRSLRKLPGFVSIHVHLGSTQVSWLRTLSPQKGMIPWIADFQQRRANVSQVMQKLQKRD